MSVDWLSSNWPVLLIGISFFLVVGCLIQSSTKSPLRRQRSGELAIFCVLIWLMTAFIPLPRLLNVWDQGGVRHVIQGKNNGLPRASMGETNFAMDIESSNVQRDQTSLALSDLIESDPVSERNYRGTEASQQNLSKHASVSWIESLLKLDTGHLIAGAYLAIVVILSIWLIVGRVLIWWITRCGNKLSFESELVRQALADCPLMSKIKQDRFFGRISIIQSNRCGLPFAFGVFRPKIVLPTYSADSASQSELATALRHEFAHVLRGDAIGRLIMNLAVPLLALHPLYWWLRRRAIFAAEVLADEVAALGSTRVDYSGDLLKLARKHNRFQRLILGVSPIFSSRSQFVRRIELLLSRKQDLRTAATRGELVIIAACSLLILVFGIGMLGMGQDNSEEQFASGSPYANAQVVQGSSLDNVISTSADTPAVAIVIPKSETVEVRGIILNADGSPAVAATVWAAAMHESPPHRERVSTDGKGQFKLNLKPLYGEYNRWELIAVRDEEGAKIEADLSWIKDSEPQQPAPIEVHLSSKARMRCHALSFEQKLPIANARLYLGDGRIFVSDQDGWFDITGLENGRHEFTVIAGGYERLTVIFDNTLQSASKLNLYLTQASQIVGLVTDKHGRPVPHAAIESPRSGSALALDGYVSLADNQGRFTWEGMPLNRSLRLLQASAEGYEPQYASHLTAINESPVNVSFQLPSKRPVKERHTEMISYLAAETQRNKNGAFRGQVVDMNGLPVQDFRVTLDRSRNLAQGDLAVSSFGADMKWYGASFTSDDGRFVLGDRIEADVVYRVVVKANGYSNVAIDNVLTCKLKDIDIAREYVFQLGEPKDLAIEVFSASDKDKNDNSLPIENARVTLIDGMIELDYLQFTWNSDEVSRPFRLTDKNGQAEFDQIPDTEGTIVVQAPGYARQRFGWREGESQFKIELAPESRIIGNFINSSSIPTDELGLSLLNLDNGSGYWFSEGTEIGTIQIDQLTAGKYQFTVYTGRDYLYSSELEVAIGERLSVDLQLEASGNSMSSHVLSSAKNPVRPGVVATIDGRDPTKLSFAEGLSRFKKYTRFALAKELTESQLRQALLRASVEREGFEHPEAENEVVSVLKEMSAGDIWPAGVKLYANSRFGPPGATDQIFYQLHIPHAGGGPGSPTLRIRVED